MAISTNPLMHGVRGSINKQIVFRIVGGQTVVSAYPNMSRVKRTAKQKKQNNRMKLVNDIIADIKADPEKKNAALLDSMCRAINCIRRYSKNSCCYSLNNSFLKYIPENTAPMRCFSHWLKPPSFYF